MDSAGTRSEARGHGNFGDQELIRLFDLDGISHSNAVFDRAKLDWFNTEYIRAYPAEKLLPLIQEEWHKAGLEPADTDRDWLFATINLLKPRARSLKDFATSFRAFFTDTFQPDPAAVEKFLHDERVRQLLVELGDRYAASEDTFTEAETEKTAARLRRRKRNESRRADQRRTSSADRPGSGAKPVCSDDGTGKRPHRSPPESHPRISRPSHDPGIVTVRRERPARATASRIAA